MIKSCLLRASLLLKPFSSKNCYMTSWPWPLTSWPWSVVTHRKSCDEPVHQVWRS